MKALRLPGWLETSVLARYQARASHLFLLHGNVRDLQPFGADYVPLPEGLKRLCAGREVLALYDVSSGLSFGSAAQEKAFRKALGFKGPLPSDPARALVLLDALVTSEKIEPDRVAVVLDYAHALAPSGPASSTERAAITTLARWATEAKVADRRPFIVLMAPAAGDVSDEVFAGGSAAEVVEVPKPDLESRADYARVLQERFSEVRWDMPPARLAAETGGLSLTQMEDILQRTQGARVPLGPEQVVGRKIDLLKQEYGDVLEILNPRYDLSAVGGLEHAVRELREVAEIMKKGQTSAAPMGIVLMGPPGTGKSYLAECFAKECGILCVRFRPLRQMYVGQSERNQEKAFAAIRALAPVVVIVDESDQAEGGSRDQGSGDSGVTERMRGAAFSFWGEGAMRGKVLRIDITNRIDLIDSAMRRSGRTDVKIPILMPDETARRQIFEVTVRKHKLASAVADFAPFAKRTEGFTGSDIELALTTAWRFALRDGKTALDDASLTAALDDLLPTTRDQAAVDRMTLMALDECRNKRLLPSNHEAIRATIAARLGR